MQPLAEIRSLIARRARMSALAVPLPGVTLAATDTPHAAFSALYKPGLALIVQGAKRTVLGDKVFEYSAGQYLVVSVLLPVKVQVVRASREAPYLVFCLTLDPAEIAALLLEKPAGDRRPAPLAGMAVSTAPADLLDAVVRLLRLADHPNDIPVLAPMLKREILWRLLTGEQGEIVRQIGVADGRLSQIARATHKIRTSYSESLSIEALAQVAGMSVTSFHRHFRAITAMTPLQYQKQIRLQEARTRLIREAKDVASVGFDVGYESPSQFSREYSRLFGLSPARDMKRLRGNEKLHRSPFTS